MPNPSKRDSMARKVVGTARSIVTYQVGLSEGCLQILFCEAIKNALARKKYYTRDDAQGFHLILILHDCVDAVLIPDSSARVKRRDDKLH